jgi:hypothetical protein
MENEIRPSCVEVPPGPRDWRFGGETGFDAADRPARSWGAYLPDTEIQYQRRRPGSLASRFDTSACVTFSCHNALETLYTEKARAGAIPAATVSALAAAGFVVGNQVNLSDRDTAARAGTDEQTGNSFNRVLETLRTVGPIPEADHPFDPAIQSWEEYMVPGPQLQAKRDLWLATFGLKYEMVFWSGDNLTMDQKLARIAAALADGPVLASTPVCPAWSRSKAREGVPIADCGMQKGGHATLLYRLGDLERMHFDHYEPFRKTLDRGYWLQHAFRVSLELKGPTAAPAPKKPTPPEVSLKLGSTSRQVLDLQACLAYLGYQSVRSHPDRPKFGERTREALLAFQLAERVDDPAELARLNGEHYGPRTKAALWRVLRARS